MRGADMTNLEVKEKVEGARTRSNIYGFLSSMFREEINAERLLQIKGPDIKEVLSEMGIQYEIFSQKDQDQLLEDLAVEYARLFLGPDKHISPHESVHHQRDDGDWGTHWGGSTVDVKKFIESAGLEYKQEYSGMPQQLLFHRNIEYQYLDLFPLPLNHFHQLHQLGNLLMLSCMLSIRFEIHR